MGSLEVAKHYFELSNDSNLDEIRRLMTESTTYSSQNTGVYLGVDQIMEMQRDFHGGFETLGWEISHVEEVRPGVVCFDFVFSGKKKTGEEVRRLGIEYIIVYNEKLQHIEVRNK